MPPGARALARCGFCAHRAKAEDDPARPGSDSTRLPRGSGDRPRPAGGSHRAEQKAQQRPGNVPGPRPSHAVSPGGEPQPGRHARPAAAGAPHPPLAAASGPAAGTVRRREIGGKGRNATAPAAPRDGGRNRGGSTMRPAQPLPLPVTKAPQPRGCLRFSGLRDLRRPAEAERGLASPTRFPAVPSVRPPA